MAVTAAPTQSLTSIASYRAANPGAQLTHVGLVSTAPGSLATPSLVAGGFFDVWYNQAANVLILDYSSTGV